MNNKTQMLKAIQAHLARAKRIGYNLGYMYEDADVDSVTGKRIHNLTISWFEPDEKEK